MKSKTVVEKSLYKDLDSYLNGIHFPNDYAVLSHYILLQDSDRGFFYKRILEENKVDLSQIPSKTAYQKAHGIELHSKSKPVFSFIDLFAGIGGFRQAMQTNGGECVFTSEWDAAAQQTYSYNYGEVPFGDIT